MTERARPSLLVRRALLVAVTAIPVIVLGSILVGFGRTLVIVAIAVLVAAGLVPTTSRA